MRSPPSSHVCLAFTMALFCACFIFPRTAVPQGSGSGVRTLRVGLIEAPPLYHKIAQNRWEGFGVELWQAVAKDLETPFEFREFSSFDGLLEAFEKREIDVIPALPVRERFVASVEFSLSYLKSGLAIAVPAESVEYSWLHIFEGLFSKESLKAIGMLLSMSLIAGFIVWLLERRHNSEMFSKKTFAGIGHGIWWAMVTMTTVGYGDMAPKTKGGRIVALIWMIFSVVFVAVFTANITMSLAIKELHGRVRGFDDLHHVRVGAVSGSEGFDYLNKQGITVIPFESLQEGLQATAEKRIDAFVQNEQILKFMARNDFPGRVQVLPGTFDEYFVSMAMPLNSPLRKAMNEALLKYMKTANWTALLNRYLK
jgi:polar amino acid transport system substrate-binding protein